MPTFRAAPSRLAFAVALATSAAVGLTATATPAVAAKKEKKEEPAKANYSKEFIAAYQPMSKVLKEEGDIAGLSAQVPTLVAAATTPDDKLAAGQIIVNIGVKANNTELQRQGLDMMLDSGKMAAVDLPKNTFIAAQLAYNAKDYAAARARAEQAVAAGYTGDAELLIAESYFAQDQAPAGIQALDKAIAKKVAAGQEVPENWLKRGLAQSYQAKLDPETIKYAGLYAQYYPSKASWGDAIAVQRNLSNYEGQDLLDLMRLAQRTDSMRYERDYADYITAADPRRLPGETQRIIDAGIAAGLLKANDPFVSEARSIAAGRVKADQSDLSGLENDARKPNAPVATLMAAGDAFLSYQQPAKAEEFYKLALAKPGVETPRVLTRLGIAQLDQRKFAEADANFRKVQGARQAIAQLWQIYAKQAAAGTTAAQ